MKFTIAVVVFALAVSAQAGILPLAYSYPWAAAPWTASPWAAHPLTYAAPLSYTAHSAPLAYSAVHIAPAHYAAPAIIPVAAEGTYTAATRGAVHVAPLPGHTQSAASVNLEPAPGTF